MTNLLLNVVLVVLTLIQLNLCRSLSKEEIVERIPKNSFEEFRNSAKKPGLEIWRIEKFKLIRIPISDYGTFYTGDSYLVLSTQLISSKLFSNIYYWIGKESSQDEYGAVAIYAINLRQHLNDQPSTKREEQGNESKEFLKHFPNKLIYKQGGVESGFRHVDTDQFEKKLYLIKGKRNIRVKPVPVSIASLNHDDSFVLDTKDHIYIFNGKNSKILERLKADTFSTRLDQDHSGRTKKIEVDEQNSAFLKELNVDKVIKIPETSPILDNDFEKDFAQNVQLLRINERGQKVYVDKINEKQLIQSLLKSDDCYILKDGDQTVFLWIGKKCNNKERNEALKKFPSAKKIIEKAEPALFTEYFFTWKTNNEKNYRLI